METSTEFEWTVWSLTSRDIPSIDRFLADSEGSGIWDYISQTGDAVGQENRARLMEMREAAYQAFKGNDIPRMEERVEALFVAARELWYRWKKHNDARKGEKYGKTQSEIASEPRKLTQQEQKIIAKEYWHKVDIGEKYGAVKELASRFDVCTETIRATAKKYPPN